MIQESSALIYAIIAWLQQITPTVHFGWDDFRTALLTVIAAGVSFQVRITWTMRDKVRDMSLQWPTLNRKMNAIDHRVQRIEMRNMKLDAIYRDYVSDVQQHPGEERRRSGQRLRHSLRSSLEDELALEEEEPLPSTED